MNHKLDLYSNVIMKPKFLNSSTEYSSPFVNNPHNVRALCPLLLNACLIYLKMVNSLSFSAPYMLSA